MSGGHEVRTFKTAWFLKAALKALITDEELCGAIVQVGKGRCDDLGGGIFKKRLDKNRHRSIVLAKGEPFWVYAFLFAKKDRANIADDERAFRDLARLYDRKTEAEIGQELREKVLVEICHGDEN